MRARVIRPRHVRAIAASIGGSVGAALLATGTDGEPWLPVHDMDWQAAYHRAHVLAHVSALLSSVAFVLAAIVPLILLARRESSAEVSLRSDGLSIGLTSIDAKEVTGFSVAPDGHGFSVAIGTGEKTTFLEVDSLDDARRMATALTLKFPLDRNLTLTLPRQSPGFAVGMFSLAALAFAGLVPAYERIDPYMMGILALNGGLIFTLLIVLVILRTRRPMRVGWGTSERRAAERNLDWSPIERHVRRHQQAMLKKDPAPPRVRVDLFARGVDTVADWLARIDGLERAGGYRGESAPSELLFETVADPHAAIDVRLAAARLLRLRDNEDRIRIAAAVADLDVRARIEAVMEEDASRAADALEAIGPLFRTG